jgi:hypothetical protein
MKPILLGEYIPPVTGVGGIPGNVVSNSFDVSNFFRSRSNSKRIRRDNSDIENRFDLTRDFPPLIFPEKVTLDLDSVSSLMVGVAADMPAIREIAEKTENREVKMLAENNMKLYALLEAVLERVVKPMAGAGATTVAAPPGGGAAPPSRLDLDKKALTEALEESDKTVILHDANLGQVPIANSNFQWHKSCHHRQGHRRRGGPERGCARH